MNMHMKKDTRDLREFLATFFNIGATQGNGGILLGVFSFFHSYVREEGLSALAWYSANFDFETLLTVCYTFVIRRLLTAHFFEFAGAKLDAHIELGQVLTESKHFSWHFFVVQFIFMVIIVGTSARIFSISTIVLLSFVPFDPLRVLARFYYALPLTCEGLVLTVLYIKPAIVDGLMFIITEYIMTKKSVPNTSLKEHLNEQAM
tara:strand:+ start:508 stop:1119 length:612 start_codon:yes stop_codon:yes gene_type:complete